MAEPNAYLHEVKKTFSEPLLVAAVVGVLALYIAFVVLWHLNLPLFAWLTEEDSVLEYGTALLMFLSAIVFAWHSTKTTSRLQRTWLIISALALLFMAGEEISWGQRIFGFRWESLERINEQQEANLHNLPFIHAARLLSIGSLGLGFLVPVLLLSSGYCRRIAFQVFRFPIPHPVASLCFLLSYVWYRQWHGGPPDSAAALSVEESREFGIGVACLLFAVLLPRFSCTTAKAEKTIDA